MTDQHGMIWWNELNTRDPEKAAAYYTAVCGWEIDRVPMGDGQPDYYVAKRDGQPAAGIFDMSAMDDMSEMPPHWFTYIAVTDLAQALEQTRASGGKVVREPFTVPDAGDIAVVWDPSGAAIGLMKPAAQPG